MSSAPARLRAPVIIAVGVDKPSEPKVLEIENICAAAAAAAKPAPRRHWPWAWAPCGAPVPLPLTHGSKQFLGLAPDQHLIGFIYLGYPEGEHIRQDRPGFADRTTWLD